MSFVCDEIRYVYDAEKGTVTPRPSGAAANASFGPKLTPSQAVTVAGFLGVSNAAEIVSSMPPSFDAIFTKSGAKFFAFLTGFLVGYLQWQEAPGPSCGRKELKDTVGDTGFWNSLYRWRVAEVERQTSVPTPTLQDILGVGAAVPAPSP